MVILAFSIGLLCTEEFILGNFKIEKNLEYDAIRIYNTENAHIESSASLYVDLL